MESTSTSALSYAGNSGAATTVNPDPLDTALYYGLFREAEAVRWKMSDIPFDEIEDDKVSPALIDLVRANAAAELTTWTATNQFFHSFSDDVDFTQWMTVWLYEETKHPQALMRWLKHFGESFDNNFFLEGRKTYPFMNSKMGTLCFNILSEIEASTYYLSVYKNVQEPVLRLITKHLAADEARHASSFYVYAKKRLAQSDNPQHERFEALKMLYFWLVNSQNVKHPVALFTNKIASGPEFEELERIVSFKSEHVYARMRTMIGNLVGLTLDNKEEVRKNFLQLQKENSAIASA